uniref:PDZ domain-containing protein n=1 Tax=Cyanistes caeruleus TaxID=156563 RepID=A0A8C0VNW9_CYACU
MALPLPQDTALKWASPSQSPEEHRRVVMLEKKAEESFGFEIQTYGLHHQDRNSVEMFTFVCRVHDGSPAEAAGLKAGEHILGEPGGTPAAGTSTPEAVCTLGSRGHHHRGERAERGGHPAPGDRGDHQELRQCTPARHSLRDVHPEGRAGGPAAVPEGEQGLAGVTGGWGPLSGVLTPHPPHSKPSTRSGGSFAR